MSELKKDSVEFKSLRYVEVQWLDAAVGDSWVDIKGDADIDVAKCYSRGWVIRQDETQIVVAGTVSLDKDGLVDGANNSIAIPQPMILSVTDFPIRPKRRAVGKKKQKVEQLVDPAVLTEQVKEALNG